MRYSRWMVFFIFLTGLFIGSFLTSWFFLMKELKWGG